MCHKSYRSGQTPGDPFGPGTLPCLFHTSFLSPNRGPIINQRFDDKKDTNDVPMAQVAGNALCLNDGHRWNALSSQQAPRYPCTLSRQLSNARGHKIASDMSSPTVDTLEANKIPGIDRQHLPDSSDSVCSPFLKLMTLFGGPPLAHDVHD